jgi:hypothetical protein
MTLRNGKNLCIFIYMYMHIHTYIYRGMQIYTYICIDHVHIYECVFINIFNRLIVLSMSALLSLNSNALPEDIKVNVQNIYTYIYMYIYMYIYR